MQKLNRLRLGRSTTWGLILFGALIAFELFNFSTTEYALGTFFGAHDTLGLASWATVLAIAFCGIDFAGLSRLFTRESGWRKEPREVWLLTGAWFLGALMNAVMTWWAVATALLENPFLGNELITREQILHIVPLFVALLVWMTRVMLIGTIGAAGDRLFKSGAVQPSRASYTQNSAQSERARRFARPRQQPIPATAAGKPSAQTPPARIPQPQRTSARASTVSTIEPRQQPNPSAQHPPTEQFFARQFRQEAQPELLETEELVYVDIE